MQNDLSCRRARTWEAPPLLPALVIGLSETNFGHLAAEGGGANNWNLVASADLSDLHPRQIAHTEFDAGLITDTSSGPRSNPIVPRRNWCGSRALVSRPCCSVTRR